MLLLLLLLLLLLCIAHVHMCKLLLRELQKKRMLVVCAFVCVLARARERRDSE
jgi:hypothetical protein